MLLLSLFLSIPSFFFLVITAVFNSDPGRLFPPFFFSSSFPLSRVTRASILHFIFLLIHPPLDWFTVVVPDYGVQRCRPDRPRGRLKGLLRFGLFPQFIAACENLQHFSTSPATYGKYGRRIPHGTRQYGRRFKPETIRVDD